MRLFSRIFLFLSFVYAFGVCGYILSQTDSLAHAQTTHIVISQIQIAGTAGANDEFVELYNPTDTNIDLTGWRLSKKTATGTTYQHLITSMTGSIAPNSYLLIAHPSSTVVPTADKLYSSTNVSLTANNTIYLFSDAGITLVDKVGIGTATDFETAPFPQNPDIQQSLLRKVSVFSLEQTVMHGGSEYNYGNSYDTDNNATDFLLLTTSQPKNSQFQTLQTIPTSIPTPTIYDFPTNIPTTIPTEEPTVIPTNPPFPTATIIPLPTVMPLPTLETPTPTVLEENTPTPSTTPTEIPLPTDQVIPTTSEPTSILPSNYPTQEPYPTLVLPTATPTIIPTVLPVHKDDHKIVIDTPFGKHQHLICINRPRYWHILRFAIKIPILSCKLHR